MGHPELPRAGLDQSPRFNKYPADYFVAPPHLTGLISGSLRPVKASRTLPEPARPGAPPMAHAGAAPASHPGTAAGPP